MKKIISILLISSIFSLSAFAHCNQQYEEAISDQFEKVKAVKKVGLIATGVTFGTMTAFWGTMGVILVGPAGVIIGLTFGAFIAAPVAGTFFVVKKSKEARLENLIKAYSLIQASEEIPGADQTSLNKLFKEIVKAQPTYSLAELKQEVRTMNDTETFCNGSIKEKILGYNHLRRYFKTPELY